MNKDEGTKVGVANVAALTGALLPEFETRQKLKRCVISVEERMQMKRQRNGQLGDWEANTTIAKPIEIDIKCACLELFKQGAGYKKAAKTLGLKRYTVRDWGRRFKIGDESWAHRDGRRRS